MIRVDSAADQVNVAKVYEAGQEQIFEYWDEISASERTHLLEQIAAIDFAEFGRLVSEYLDDATEPAHRTLGDLSAPDWIGLDFDPAARATAREAGEEALRSGQVASLLLAGGQGTRLKFDGPKGKFAIGPVTGRSLFHHHAERLVALEKRYRRSIPLIVMTSDLNHDETVAFFEEHDHFGLRSSDVKFERQGTLPIVDPRRGKILLSERGSIALSPNGHGGAIEVAQRCLEFLRNRGIETLTTFQVDNPLGAIADPEFVGFHRTRNSKLTSKAVAKTGPEEKVGVFAVRGGRLQVVEYTELTDDDRNARNDAGELLFRAGNLAQHAFSVDFLDPEVSDFQMPYHIAKKGVRYVRDGEVVEPDGPNSIRFESFIFDALEFADPSLVLEVAREEEFAPVKNFEGADSPETCRALLTERWARWLESAGIDVPREDGRVSIPIEIAPTYALDAEELRRKLEADPVEELVSGNPARILLEG